MPIPALRRAAVIAAAIASLLAPRVSLSGDLSNGDILLAPADSILAIDPASGGATRVTGGQLLHQILEIDVATDGTIFVLDAVSGVVAVDPVTRTQSIVADLSAFGGAAPQGVCVTPQHVLYVSATRDGHGVVFQLEGTGSASAVSEGGLLAITGGIDDGPDGRLYVADRAKISTQQGFGSIIQIDPATGAQVRVTPDEVTLYGPFDIAVTADGNAYTSQVGSPGRYAGSTYRTRLSDGFTESVDIGMSVSVAASPGGQVVVCACETVSRDCWHGYVRLLGGAKQYTAPAGTYVFGPVAVFESSVTPVMQSTWGQVKLRYR